MTNEELLRTIEQAEAEGWTELDLSDRGLTELPAAIGRLMRLESLDLSGNELMELPPEFGQLTNLLELDLRTNQLTQLPPEFGQLINLSQLSLSNNQLTQLPPEFGQLVSLAELYLRCNQLIQLPPEFGQLVNLSELSLRSNHLTQLPPELGQLINLSQLYLRSNQLTQLPPEFDRLPNLSRLSLSNNQFTQLPLEIVRLSNLSKLGLIKNQLKELPSEIGQLSNLSELYLSNNQLTQLPPEIGQLQQLTVLDLENLPLTTLPTEIQRLNNLKKLDLRGTLLQIPSEFLGNDWDDLGDPANILNFYFPRETMRPLNEAKMLVLGQGSVGKTSLIKQLLHRCFDPQENKTEGIQIQHWPVPIDDREVQLNVWDFGGQEIMHATHQFFLSQRSLYLLVLDNRLEEAENRLEYWLKIVQSFGGESPIIVVGNKADQQALDLDRRGLQLKYPRIKAFVQTSCQTGAGIEALRAVITEEVGQLPHVKDELPLNWFEVKQQLEAMERDYIPYSDYEQLCREQGIENGQSQQTLIGFLHDLGVVLNFRDDPRLEETNVLNPVWVTNGVYRILNDNALMTEHKGVLARRMLDRILAADRYPRSKQLFVIDMMRKFELCFDLEPDEQFLIPDLLSKEEPDTGDWSEALAFQFHYNVLPGSVISRFMVRASELISQRTYWRSGVVLAHEGSRALVKADREERQIFIWVGGAQATRRQLLAIVRAHLAHIHGTISGLEVVEKVPLPGRPQVVVSYQYLLGLERRGERSFIPEDLGERVAVKPLLDGIVRQEERWEEGVERDRTKQERDRLSAKFLERERDLYRQQSQDWKQLASMHASRGNHIEVRGATVNMSETEKEETHFHAPVGSVGNQGTQTNVAGVVEGDQIGSQVNPAAESLTREEVLALLAQIKALIEAAEVPGEVKIAANANLQVAQKATAQEEPKKAIALATLETVAETLEAASKTAEAGKTLWEQVSPILVQVGSWLGAAAGSVLMVN